MNPRQKKLIIVLATPFFLLGYIILALALSDHVPDQWFLQLVFYVVIGTVWAFPIKPVFVWANTPGEDEE